MTSVRLSELTGTALNDFLLRNSGKTWDDVIEARAGFEDINEKRLLLFYKHRKGQADCR